MKEVNYIKTKLQYLYKVRHCYRKEERSIFFKSKIPHDELIRILACIDFKFEELVDESGLMDEESVLEILEKFYKVEKLSDELKKGIQGLDPKEIEENGIAIKQKNKISRVYNIYNDETQLIEIDRYSAREYCCGPNYANLMEKQLPNTVEFIKAIKSSSVVS